MARTAKKKIAIFDEGVEITPDADSIDFTGSGLSASGDPDVTVNGTGGGSGSLGELAATGAKDDTNREFTFASKPVVIIVNGSSYRENRGWTWNGGTLTATLASPVGAGGDIYGLA